MRNYPVTYNFSEVGLKKGQFSGRRIYEEPSQKLWHYGNATYCPKGCIYQYKLFSSNKESSDPVCRHTLPTLPDHLESDWVIKNDCLRPPSGSLFTNASVVEATSEYRDRIAFARIIRGALENAEIGRRPTSAFPQTFEKVGPQTAGLGPIGSNSGKMHTRNATNDNIDRRSGNENCDDSSILRNRSASYASVLSSSRVSNRLTNLSNYVQSLHPDSSPLPRQNRLCIERPKCIVDSQCVPSSISADAAAVRERSSSSVVSPPPVLPNHGEALPVGGSTSNIWSPHQPSTSHDADEMQRKVMQCMPPREFAVWQMSQVRRDLTVAAAAADLHQDVGVYANELPLFAQYVRYVKPGQLSDRPRHYISRQGNYENDLSGIRYVLAPVMVPQTASTDFAFWSGNYTAAGCSIQNKEAIMIRSEEVIYGMYKEI